jgi:hypothetical protein
MVADRHGSVLSRRFVQGTSLAGLGLLAACRQLPWPARQPRIPRVGFLSPGTRENRAARVDRFLQGLSEHGYTDGQN